MIATYLFAVVRNAYFGVIVLLSFIQLFHGTTLAALSYDPYLVEHHAQWWRLISAHFVHVGWEHFIWNCLAFTLIAFFPQKQLSHKKLWSYLIILSLIVSALYSFFGTSLYRYAGFSGIAHGIILLIETPMRWLLWSVTLAKVIFEQTPFYSTKALSEQIGAQVYVDAHMFGAIAGIIIYLSMLCYAFYIRQRSK